MGGLSFDELFNSWINDFAKETKSTWDEDIRRYDNYIKEHFGDLPITEITPEKIRRWRTILSKQISRRGKTLSKSTIKQPLFCNFSWPASLHSS